MRAPCPVVCGPQPCLTFLTSLFLPAFSSLHGRLPTTHAQCRRMPPAPRTCGAPCAQPTSAPSACPCPCSLVPSHSCLILRPAPACQYTPPSDASRPQDPEEYSLCLFCPDCLPTINDPALCQTPPPAVFVAPQPRPPPCPHLTPPCPVSRRSPPRRHPYVVSPGVCQSCPIPEIRSLPQTLFSHTLSDSSTCFHCPSASRAHVAPLHSHGPPARPITWALCITCILTVAGVTGWSCNIAE